MTIVALSGLVFALVPRTATTTPQRRGTLRTLAKPRTPAPIPQQTPDPIVIVPRAEIDERIIVQAPQGIDEAMIVAPRHGVRWSGRR
jgi:hypothetical protein